MQILNGELLRGDINKNAQGGTELMCERIVRDVDKDLLSNFQIVVSRPSGIELDPDKIRLLYCHDLPDDPESQHLANGGWQKYHRIIFVSNWQMQQYIAAYDIPWSHCLVLSNAIEPIEQHEKPEGVINIAYWSTPHRGLNLLIPVFTKLAEEYDNINLNVYSSFDLYGWKERDKEFEQLFDRCREHEKINYHGAIPNADLREALKDNHILAYPSTWVETSCLVLMEAMSAGMACVHSNLGALYETAGHWTMMYQMQDDPNIHAGALYHQLKHLIENIDTKEQQSQIASAKSYANIFYNWNIRAEQWTSVLNTLKQLEPKPVARSNNEVEARDFVYEVG